MMPLVLDDVFRIAEHKRAAQMFRALGKFAPAGIVRRAWPMRKND